MKHIFLGGLKVIPYETMWKNHSTWPAGFEGKKNDTDRNHEQKCGHKDRRGTHFKAGEDAI